MAVTHIATSARSAGGTTTVAPAYPAGVSVGRLAIASRVIKPSTATGTAETGWTQLVTQTGGTAAAAADVGQTRIVVDTRILVGSETGSVTFDNATTPDSSHGVIQIYDPGGGTWAIVTTTGDDTLHTTGRNATGGAIALAPNDVLLAILASDTDTATAFTGVSTSISAPGITFGTTSQRLSAGGVTTGFDSGLHIYEATVSSGTASAAPSIALTGGPTNCGPVAFVRLRATTPVSGVVSADFGFTAAPSGVDRALGAVSAAFGFTSSPSGVDRALGATVSAFGFTATTAGNDRALGVVAATFGFTSSLAGVATTPAVTGQAVGSFGFTAATAGIDRSLGVVSAVFTFTAAPSGIPRPLGVATSSFGFAASVAGADRALGQATAAFTFAATASGTDRALGVTVAAFGFTAATSGAAGDIPIQGQALAAFGFTASLVGIDRSLGQADTSFGFAATSTGATRPLGVVSPVFDFSANAVGTVRVIAAVSAAFGFTADASALEPRDITFTARIVAGTTAVTLGNTRSATIDGAHHHAATIAPTRRTARIEAT